MDDLDRLYYEFVETLRHERPSGLSEKFGVLEVHSELIPYRRVRNLVGFRSNDDYEVALSRLLSGERGYLLCDGDMQAELRAGLEEPLPDINRYKAFPDVRVWLNAEIIPPPGDIRYAPPEMRERSEWATPAVESASAEPAGASDGTGESETETLAISAPLVAEPPVTGAMTSESGFSSQVQPDAEAEPPGESTPQFPEPTSAPRPARSAGQRWNRPGVFVRLVVLGRRAGGTARLDAPVRPGYNLPPYP
jgi:hypothetical protein